MLWWPDGPSKLFIVTSCTGTSSFNFNVSCKPGDPKIFRPSTTPCNAGKHSNGKVQGQLHACRYRAAATPMCGVDNVINRPSRHIYKQGMGQRRLGGHMMPCRTHPTRGSTGTYLHNLQNGDSHTCPDPLGSAESPDIQTDPPNRDRPHGVSEKPHHTTLCGVGTQLAQLLSTITR
jgi:hypothetical protein